MHRLVDAGPESGPGTGLPVDVQATKRRYLQDHGSQSLNEAMLGMVRKLLGAVLSDLAQAGLRADGSVYLPRLMDATLDTLYAPAVAELTDRPLARRGHVTGHLGAGDLIANLADAQQDQRGPRVDLFISAGAGFTVSIAAIETLPQARP
jgi:3-oxoacyl-[acyl-carrier-protein] synthase-3